MVRFFNWLQFCKLAFTALYRREHFYIVVATLDDFKIYQHAQHMSTEAIAPVLDHVMQDAVEKGIMAIRPCEHQQALLNAREQEYAEKRKRGEL